MKKNAIYKSIILAVAIAAAIGCVLFFIQYVVSPPRDISAKATADDVFNPDIKDSVAAFSPDTINLKAAEVAYNALVDRATIFYDDGLVTDKKVYDNAIAESSEKFANAFTTWSFNKFEESSWDTSDHEIMLRLIGKLRKINVDDGAKKALSQDVLSELTDIESIINNYRKAWSITRNTRFSSYQNAESLCTEARKFTNDEYLSNCTNLVHALNLVGENLEKSCFNQLLKKVGSLKYLDRFNKKDDYDEESKRIFEEIGVFEKTTVFGISTKKHYSVLSELHDYYDKIAESYNWPESNQLDFSF